MNTIITVLAIFAFIIGLQGGQKIPVPGAVGFGKVEREYKVEGKSVTVPCHVFFDKEGRELLVVPDDLLFFGIYVPDNGVM